MADLIAVRTSRWWLKPLVSLVLYVLIFSYWVDVWSIAALLRSSDLRLVALAVAIYCGGQLASAYRWRLLLRPLRLTASYGSLAAAYFIGMFFNIFLPTIVGGDAVKAVLLARQTGSPARATISVFMDRNVGLFALLAVATTAAWYAPVGDGVGRPLALLTTLALAAYAGVNLTLMHARTYGLVDGVIARTKLAGTRHRAASLYEALAPYKAQPAIAIAAIAVSFLHQAVVIGVVFLNARALGQSFPLSALGVFVPLVSLAGMVPVTINGMGLREAAYVLLFGRLGASQPVSVSLALLYLTVTFLASLPGGIVYAVRRAPAATSGG